MYFFPYFGEAKCEKDTVDQCVYYTFWHLLGYSVDEDALVLCWEQTQSHSSSADIKEIKEEKEPPAKFSSEDNQRQLTHSQWDKSSSK